MKKTIVLLAVLLTFSLSACGTSTKAPEQGGGTPPQGGAPTTTVDASAVFTANCVSCHGNNLEGSVGPNLQKVGAEYSKDQIDAIVTNGRGGMPSFKDKLTKDEITSVADWLATKK